MVDYKFNEGALIQEFHDYIDSTYGQHYSQDKFQAAEFIIDSGHGMGFALGNVLKYAQRYGKKDGTNRKDLMKILHYALIALHQHDLDEKEKKKNIPEFKSSMYNSSLMDYNSITFDLDGSVTSISSIDGTSPENWNQTLKTLYGKKDNETK